MDCQSRNDSFSYREHADEGRYLRSMSGWTKDVAVASAMYHHSHGYFRLSADPAVEAQMYMKAGLAGGFNPFWHHPTAYTADKRHYEIAPPLFQWHKRHEADFGGVPVAIAGVVRSEDNAIFAAAGGGGPTASGGAGGRGAAAAAPGGRGGGCGGRPRRWSWWWRRRRRWRRRIAAAAVALRPSRCRIAGCSVRYSIRVLRLSNTRQGRDAARAELAGPRLSEHRRDVGCGM